MLSQTSLQYLCGMRLILPVRCGGRIPGTHLRSRTSSELSCLQCGPLQGLLDKTGGNRLGPRVGCGRKQPWLTLSPRLCRGSSGARGQSSTCCLRAKTARGSPSVPPNVSCGCFYWVKTNKQNNSMNSSRGILMANSWDIVQIHPWFWGETKAIFWDFECRLVEAAHKQIGGRFQGIDQQRRPLPGLAKNCSGLRFGHGNTRANEN